MSFMVFDGRFEASTFIGFCERLIKQARGKVFLIVGWPSGTPRRVDDELVGKPIARVSSGSFCLGYALDLNPGELLNGDITRVIGQARPRDRDATACPGQVLRFCRRCSHFRVAAFKAPTFAPLGRVTE